jgi:hypothetical protein
VPGFVCKGPAPGHGEICQLLLGLVAVELGVVLDIRDDDGKGVALGHLHVSLLPLRDGGGRVVGIRVVAWGMGVPLVAASMALEGWLASLPPRRHASIVPW